MFVINGFYMSMRSAYTTPPAKIHYYTVQWPTDSLQGSPTLVSVVCTRVRAFVFLRVVGEQTVGGCGECVCACMGSTVCKCVGFIQLLSKCSC